MNIILKVVADPGPSVTGIARAPEGKSIPYFQSSGDVNMLCGECGFRLMENMESEDHVKIYWLQCPRCKAFNATKHAPS